MLKAHYWNRPMFDFESPEFWEAEGLPGFAALIREQGTNTVQSQLYSDIYKALVVFKRQRRKRLIDRCIAMSTLATAIALLLFFLWLQ